MECVLLIGIQGSGKSTFYKERYFTTHVRINLDMLRTRHKEDIFLAASFQAKQPFVVDNTNPRREDRTKYIRLCRQFGYSVTGYFMDCDFQDCLMRNERRQGKERVPAAALRRTLSLLERPEYAEGFHQLYRVYTENGQFVVGEIPP